MLLFFDTETTGKVDFKSPAHAPHQPRLVQLAALLTRPDGQELASLNVVVEPGGFEIPFEVSSIHGITTQMAKHIGVQCDTALSLFTQMSESAFSFVAWNADFDRIVIERECAAHDVFSPFPGSDLVDPMKIATDICKLPGRYGSYKWPKLEEAYRHFFGQEMSNAHDAMGDVRAMAAVYFELERLGHA